ncbi:MAG: hypothetical protein ABGX83_03710 [Nitrospira sp.]|nr:hypothetical protein [Candidatus Manganitrophaceae bacterium]HIL35418.1 hypothetical protein [Candidatus Manganitrophaceae bacterium]
MIIKERALSIGDKTWRVIRRCGTFSLVISVIGFSGIQAFAQTATLANGTVLTRVNPPKVFATEGPITDINVADRTLTVTGKLLTFPVTLNSGLVGALDVPFEMSGSSALGQDGEATTGIGPVGTFDRLLDANATVRDVNMTDPTLLTREATKDRRGAARSIFSSIEAGRDPIALAALQDNYFSYVQKAWAVHQANLPLDFLDRAGIRTGGNVYPATAGATLKSAGHVYEDSAVPPNPYFITDIETVLELSENVASGEVVSIDGGDKASGRPASMVIGDLLLIFNQDPRFGSDIFGILETTIPFNLFLSSGTGITVDTIGHMVGGHVLFIQELVTELLDTTGGVFAITERWRFDEGGNRIRFRGEVSEVNVDTDDEIEMEVVIFDPGPDSQCNATTGCRFDVDILPPEAAIGVGIGAGTTPGGVFGFRVRRDVTVANVSFVTINLRYKKDIGAPVPGSSRDRLAHPNKGDIAFTETIARVEVDGVR